MIVLVAVAVTGLLIAIRLPANPIQAGARAGASPIPAAAVDTTV